MSQLLLCNGGRAKLPMSWHALIVTEEIPMLCVYQLIFIYIPHRHQILAMRKLFQFKTIVHISTCETTLTITKMVFLLNEIF